MVKRANALKSHPWVRRVLWIALGLGVAYLALLLILSRFLDPEDLAARLEPRLEAAVSRNVDIGAAEVSFLPLGMRLTDISVADPTGLSPYLARIPSVEFQVALLPLFKREVQVRRLVVEEPSAFLTVGPDERTNFGDFSPEPGDRSEPAEEVNSAQGGSLPFSLALDEIRVTSGVVVYSRLTDSTEVSLDGLSIRASVQRDNVGAWTFEGTSGSAVSYLKKGAPGLPALPLNLSFDVGADPDFEALEIRRGGVGIEGAALEVSGTVQGLKDPIRSVSLELLGTEIPIRRLVGALPDSARPMGMELDGIVGADLRLAGQIGGGNKPDLSGTLEVKDLNVHGRGRTRLARDVSTDLTLASDGTVQVEARGEVMDGPFSLEGQAQIDGESPVDLQVDLYPDLSLIRAAVQLPEETSLEGRMKVEGRITGPARRPRNLRFWGTASPFDVRITTPKLGVPLSLPTGRVALRGSAASFIDLPIALGADSLTLSGEVSDLMGFGLPGRTVGIRGSLRGPRLNLVEISPNPPPDPALTYGRVAFARVGRRQVAGGSPEEAARILRLVRPDSLPLAGEMTVALDTLLDARGPTRDVRATASFGPGFLRLSQSSFRRYGGLLQASMNLSLGGEDLEPFSLQVSVEDLDAGSFLSATSPLGQVVRGTLSLSMELAGSLDDLLLPDPGSLMGSGHFTLTGGGLNANRVTGSLANFLGMEEFRAPNIQDWDTGFILENGKVRLAEATLAEAPGDPRVGGSIGLDGGLDLLSAFTLPSNRLGSFARENLGIAGEVAGRVANRPEVVQAVVRIGGSILSPDLKADPEATAAALRGALQEEFTTEAQTRIREQTQRLQNRAAGFLRNLTQPRDTVLPTTIPPGVPDSLRGDSLRADTLQPDTVRADSIKPDTTKADSLKPDTTGADSMKPDTVPPDTSLVSWTFRARAHPGQREGPIQ